MEPDLLKTSLGIVPFIIFLIFLSLRSQMKDEGSKNYILLLSSREPAIKNLSLLTRSLSKISRSNASHHGLFHFNKRTFALKMCFQSRYNDITDLSFVNKRIIALTMPFQDGIYTHLVGKERFLSLVLRIPVPPFNR